MTGETKRADDAFMRKVIWILLAAVVSQGGYLVYREGTTSKQQEINTINIGKTMDVQDKMSVIISQMASITNIMNDMRVQINNLTKEQRTTSDKLIEIMPTVERASRHMDYYDHKKEQK